MTTLRLRRLLRHALATLAMLAFGTPAAGAELRDAAPRAPVAAFGDAAGMLGLISVLPPAATPRPVVILVHDLLGHDLRSVRYSMQLEAAGFFVLEMELPLGDPTVAANAGIERIRRALVALSETPEIDPGQIGGLGFGAGAGALLAASHGASDPFAARVLLYPGCRGLVAAPAPRGPVLLLHGQDDPVNPHGECAALARSWAWTAHDVVHRAYAAASYAWDKVGVNVGDSLEPRPDGAGRVRSRPWAELADLSAAQVAGFFATRLTTAAR